MATEIVNTYETYGATGLREELADRIWMITPEETPFTSLIGKRLRGFDPSRMADRHARNP